MLQLVEVINEDYNDFVSLSTKLVNVDGAVLRMQAPLLDLQVSFDLSSLFFPPGPLEPQPPYSGVWAPIKLQCCRRL